MPKYITQVDQRTLSGSGWDSIPARFKILDSGVGAAGYRLRQPMSAADWLVNCGFPQRVCIDPVHGEPLPELETTPWAPFMLIAGPYRSGKTTLVANAVYWCGYLKLDRELELQVERLDAHQFTQVLVMADKGFGGLPAACDRFTGGEITGERLQHTIEDVLAGNCLLILDDFNLDAVSTEEQMKKVSQVVMTRYMNRQPTWLVSNERLDVLLEKFPRLMSRVTSEPDWSVIVKQPISS